MKRLTALEISEVRDASKPRKDGKVAIDGSLMASIFATAELGAAGRRERLADDRSGRTHHFTVLYAATPLEHGEGSTALEEIDGYIRTGEYADGRLGEIFITVSKMGALISGMMEGFATAFSIALQSGADPDQLINKLIGMRFEPYGPTNNPEIPRCTSLLDYVGRWLRVRYGTPEPA